MSKTALTHVSDVFVHDGGASVSLRLENASGDRFDMSLSKDALTEFIENLIDLGTTAAKTRTEGKPVSLQSSPPEAFSANEITGVAVGESSDARSLVMALRLYDYDLTFSTDRSIVSSLAESFAELAQQIRADSPNAD